MAKDNYVERKQYKGLTVKDGQIVPDVGDVKEEELIGAKANTEEEAQRNGGGTEDSPKRVRQPKADKE